MKYLQFSGRASVLVAVLAMGISLFCVIHPSALWVLGSFMAFQVYWTCGVACGAHRYFVHRSFETSTFWREFMVWAICAAGGLHPYISIAIHREHHKHSDTPDDPHNHYRGWGLVNAKKLNLTIPRRLRKQFLSDPVAMRIQKYYLLYPLVTATVLALVSWEALIYLWAIPAALTQVLRKTVLLDWVHRFGYQNWETNDHSRNSKILGLLFGGEGLHNNHHAFPNRWNMAMKKGELDPGAWFIRLIKR